MKQIAAHVAAQVIIGILFLVVVALAAYFGRFELCRLIVGTSGANLEFCREENTEAQANQIVQVTQVIPVTQVAHATQVVIPATPVPTISVSRPPRIHIVIGGNHSVPGEWTWICTGDFSITLTNGSSKALYDVGVSNTGLVLVLQPNSTFTLDGPFELPKGKDVGDCYPYSEGEKNSGTEDKIREQFDKGCGSKCEYVNVIELDKDGNEVSNFWTSSAPSAPVTLCPSSIPRSLVEEWNKIGETTKATAKTYIDEFDRMRVKGEFKPQDVLPAGVLIITDFGNGESLIYQQYPVRPIVHYRSWGVFETTDEYTAVQYGSCMSIAP
jgi:hypothetical protein